jgi:hypothetical protein
MVDSSQANNADNLYTLPINLNKNKVLQQLGLHEIEKANSPNLNVRGAQAMKKRLLVLIMIWLLVPVVGSHAGLVNLGPGSFTPLASQITFSEQPLNTPNPVYNFIGLPDLGNVTVNFGGNFVGQTAGGGFPITLTDHTPTPGVALALDGAAPQTFITNDASNPTSPVLSGTPTFNGPVSVLFSQPVAGVGLDGGYFNAIGATTIEAYDSLGNVLGSIVNSQLAIEFFGLADSTGQNVIAGISFFITGSEPAGFAIDNLTFGAKGAINLVPEPATLLLFGLGLTALAGASRRKIKK